MSICFILIPLLFFCGTSMAQSNVYLCTDPYGKKEYKNENQNVTGCKKIELQQIEVRERKPKTLGKEKNGVQIGMTQKEVLASSWGNPSKINKTISAKTIREQWVYDESNILYFKNNILETIQNSE